MAKTRDYRYEGRDSFDPTCEWDDGMMGGRWDRRWEWDPQGGAERWITGLQNGHDSLKLVSEGRCTLDWSYQTSAT
jgi:hypothetical protein